MSIKLSLLAVALMLGVSVPRAAHADGREFARAAFAAAQRGALTTAIGLFQKAINSGEFSGSRLAELYYDQGNAYRHSGQIASAITAYSIAIRLRPDFPLAYNNRGVARMKQGETAGAISDFKAAIRLKPDYSKAINNLGMAYSHLEHEHVKRVEETH